MNQFEEVQMIEIVTISGLFLYAICVSILWITAIRSAKRRLVSKFSPLDLTNKELIRMIDSVRRSECDGARRVYIAGKVSGLKKEVAYESFAKVSIELEKQGCQTKFTMREVGDIEGWNWLDYMRASIVLLATCNEVYFLNNSHQSPGAQVEFSLAKSLGIKISFQN